MKRVLIHATVAVALLAGLLVSGPAWAWGPRAVQSISAMALQMLKQDYPDTFRPGGVVGPNFEKDVVTGARDGVAALGGTVPLGNEKEVMQAVATEVLLLREARQYGPTSYFAYRMGVLGALTANVMMPFGFAWTPEDLDIQQRMMADIEKHLDGYGFSPTSHRREFIRDGYVYFLNKRAFHEQDKALIRNDYKRGTGYEGFLKQGGRAYFTRAVETVADVWNTVLNSEMDGVATLVKPSDRALTWYFVNEMEYLMRVKSNMHQAERVYENFEKVNPRLVEAYVKVGDIFYNFNTAESRLRGIEEWRKAYALGGPERAGIGKKLSAHYLAEGRAFLEKAGLPGATETDLNSALNAFEQALDYDRTSEPAASLIQETNLAIVARNERLEMAINIISTGEKVRAEADNFRERQDYANAIKTYRQAIGFFEAVDDEFKEQSDTAKENVRRLQKSIKDLITDVLDAASAAIDEGDRAKDGNRFDEANGAYDRVAAIVSVIPEDEKENILQDKNSMIEMAAKKKEEANVAKIRYEQAMAEQAAAAAAQQQGGAR